MSVKNLGKVGGESKVVGDVFQGGGAGSTTFGVGDVGCDPPHGPGPGRVPTQGSSTDHWVTFPEVIGRDMGVSTSGDDDSGIRV